MHLFPSALGILGMIFIVSLILFVVSLIAWLAAYFYKDDTVKKEMSAIMLITSTWIFITIVGVVAASDYYVLGQKRGAEECQKKLNSQP